MVDLKELDKLQMLIESEPRMVRYNLYKIKENEMGLHNCQYVELIKSWSELRLAQTAFELFCYEKSNIFERLGNANERMALYDDENRKLKAIIKGLLEERYCNG